MPPKATYTPKFHKHYKKWYIAIPKSASKSGKREFVYFDCREDALVKSKMLKVESVANIRKSSTIDTKLAMIAVDIDSELKFYGYGGLEDYWNQHKSKIINDSNPLSFIELLKMYEERRGVNWSEAYRKNRFFTFKRYFEGIESTKVSSMNNRFWTAFLDKWKEDGKYSNSTFNQCVTLLKAVFSIEEAIKIHPRNPIESILKKKKGVGEEVNDIPVFSVSQAELLMSTAWEHDKEIIPYFVLTAFAGLRPISEAVRVTWDDVNFEENYIKVIVTKTQGSKVRYVDLEPNAKAWLLACRPYCKDLIHNNCRKRKERVIHGYYTTKDATKSKPSEWNKLIEWGHDITRHSYASYYEAKYRGTEGSREKLISNMGHADFSMFKQYYENARTKKDGERYWDIMPPSFT